MTGIVISSQIVPSCICPSPQSPSISQPCIPINNQEKCMQIMVSTYSFFSHLVFSSDHTFLAWCLFSFLRGPYANARAKTWLIVLCDLQFDWKACNFLQSGEWPLTFLSFYYGLFLKLILCSLIFDLICISQSLSHIIFMTAFLHLIHLSVKIKHLKIW